MNGGQLEANLVGASCECKIRPITIRGCKDRLHGYAMAIMRVGREGV